jgi:hypothetical protein
MFTLFSILIMVSYWVNGVTVILSTNPAKALPHAFSIFDSSLILVFLIEYSNLKLKGKVGM